MVWLASFGLRARVCTCLPLRLAEACFAWRGLGPHQSPASGAAGWITLGESAWIATRDRIDVSQLSWPRVLPLVRSPSRPAKGWMAAGNAPVICPRCASLVAWLATSARGYGVRAIPPN